MAPNLRYARRSPTGRSVQLVPREQVWPGPSTVAISRRRWDPPVGVGSYLNLVWLGSSVGIVAGALGSSLEDEETVRKATYRRRERERQARNRRRREERTSADTDGVTQTPPSDE
jgi:hypothetical protein